MQIRRQKAASRMQQKQNDFIGFSTADCLLPSAYWVLLSAYCLLRTA